MRIKCPNCGSSAQIELTYMDHRSYDTQKTDEYICGCGCHFEVTFEVAEVKVIKNEQ
jgi:sarcosine oxidase delta subunit